MFGAVVLASCLACAEERFLPLPDQPVVKAWVAVGLGAQGQATVSLSGPDGALRLIASAPTNLLYLGGYAADARELGPIDGSCRACALLTPIHAYTWEGAGWRELSAPPDEMLDALVPDRAARCAGAPECPQLSLGELLVPSAPIPACSGPSIHGCGPAFAVPKAAGVALWVARGGQAFEVRADGVTLGCELGAVRPLDGWTNAVGDLWVLSVSNELHHLRIPELPSTGPCPVVEVVAGPTGDPIRSLAVGDGPEPELFALTSSRSFMRYDGSTWTTVYTFAPVLADNPGAIVWLGPSHAVAVMDAPELVEWSGSGISLHRPLSASSASLTTVGQASNGRLVVSIDGFGLMWSARPGGSWSAVPGTRSLHYGRALFAWSDLVLLSSGSGLDVYHQDHGLCAGVFKITGRTDPIHVVPLDAESALVAETGVFESGAAGGALLAQVVRRASPGCGGGP